MQIRCSPQTRIAVAMFAALAAAPLLSACETLFEAQAAREHPAPGKLVDVGSGRRIQIDCRGAGSPTIVFQSGGDLMGSLAWTPVMDRAAEKSRACAYSRAGILWSDPARGSFDPQEVARDLHAALKASGETGPYLLVSHSRGGLYSMIFAGLYRDEMAGLVFADSSHPDQETPLPRGRTCGGRLRDAGPGSRAGVQMDRAHAAVRLSRRSRDRIGRERLLSEIGGSQCA